METALIDISILAIICKSTCKNRHISFKCVNSCIVDVLSMDSSEESFTSNHLSMDSSEKFYDPSGHHIFFVMGWFWRLCPAL